MKLFVILALFILSVLGNIEEINGTAISGKYKQATFEHYSKIICKLRCEESTKECREVGGDLSHCETLVQTALLSHYEKCFKGCNSENQETTVLACSQNCLRKAYETSGLNVSNDLINSHLDQLQ